MQIPLQMTFRGLDSNPELEATAHRYARDLEEVCDHISSCRLAVEKEHHVSRSGRPYRVRLAITVPPGHEVVVDEDTNHGSPDEGVEQTMNSAFKKARRQLKDLTEQQREEVKVHPEQVTVAVVDKLFDDYGFLRTPEDREVYFHRNSVVNADFEDVRVGDGVAFTEDIHEEGAHASTVRVVDARGRVES
jgi:cold shock CspA family protein